jgi:GDPmannose 4,6-dehydratase
MHALITGAAGQDGILLSQQLLAEGARVTGLVKPGADGVVLSRYAPDVRIVECDLADNRALAHVIAEASADEIYNLGGVSSIVESIENPELTRRVNVGAVETILQTMRGSSKPVKFVQAASGTIFEGTDVSPQDESTPRSPKTPYAQAKARSLELIDAARGEGLFATAAILYNHESPLRGEGFVTRRITQGAARIAAGLQEHLELGNIDVSRDWGWAPDYVRGMRAMLRADTPHDYVLATGTSHQLTEFIELAFRAAGIDDWQAVVRTNEGLRRQTDPVLLRGDSSRAYAELGWQHTRTFAQIAEAMVAYDRLLIDDPNALWRES